MKQHRIQVTNNILTFKVKIFIIELRLIWTLFLMSFPYDMISGFIFYANTELA